MTGELVVVLTVAVTLATPREAPLVRVTPQIPVVTSVVQPVDGVMVPRLGLNVTGAVVVGVAGEPSVTVAVILADPPGSRTRVSVLRATLTARPDVQGLKCGRVAVIVCATGSTVEGTAIALPWGSM